MNTSTSNKGHPYFTSFIVSLISSWAGLLLEIDRYFHVHSQAPRNARIQKTQSTAYAFNLTSDRFCLLSFRYYKEEAAASLGLASNQWALCHPLPNLSDTQSCCCPYFKSNKEKLIKSVYWTNEINFSYSTTLVSLLGCKIYRISKRWSWYDFLWEFQKPSIKSDFSCNLDNVTQYPCTVFELTRKNHVAHFVQKIFSQPLNKALTRHCKQFSSVRASVKFRVIWNEQSKSTKELLFGLFQCLITTIVRMDVSHLGQEMQ